MDRWIDRLIINVGTEGCKKRGSKVPTTLCTVTLGKDLRLRVAASHVGLMGSNPWIVSFLPCQFSQGKQNNKLHERCCNDAGRLCTPPPH
jgi:hypothetical protein